MPLIIDSENRDQRNQILENWIRGLGDFKHALITINQRSIKQLPENKWIKDDLELGTVSKLLVDIESALRKSNHFYVEIDSVGGHPIFKNENSYPSFEYPNTGMRLLALFRYWNIIQYFYPYKYLIKDNWLEMPVEFIPIFIDAHNALEYRLALLKLISRIKDTHAGIFNDSILINWKGTKILPIEVRFIEKKAVLTDFFDRYSDVPPLRKGDVILKINGILTEHIVSEKSIYMSASNCQSLLMLIAFELFRTNKNYINIEYERNGIIRSDSIKTLSIAKVGLPSLQKDKPAYKIISDNILYLYTGSLQKTTISEMFNAKGIIIDLRCYPSSKINGFPEYNQLFSEPIEFANSTIGSIKYPGLFSFRSPIKVGIKNSDYYRGKLVILIDERSISQAEFLTMLYRKARNSFVVGSKTAGTDGNVSKFTLPGGIETSITGIGIYYPDNKETQRVGISPDITVLPTIKGVRENRDEILERAIALINSDR